MHKNCCHQSCSFWLRYAPNRLIVGWGFAPDPTGELAALPRLHRWYRGWGLPGKGKEGGEGKRKDGREEREGSPGMPKSRVGKPKLVAFHFLTILEANVQKKLTRYTAMRKTIKYIT